MNAQLQCGLYGSALAAAAYDGDIDAVQLLLESGAVVNAQLQCGLYGSALAAAASYDGRIEIVQLLLESGADVNAQLQCGQYGSALVAAVAAPILDTKLVQLLLKFGADVNAQLLVGKYGSALVAAITGDRWKYNSEGNIDGTDSDFSIDIESEGGSEDEDRKGVILLLLESGAEVNVQLQVGEFGSALSAAHRVGDSEVVQLLIDHGAYGDGQQSGGDQPGPASYT